MPSYQTIVRPDEKSSLLPAEFIRQHRELLGTPIIVDHYHGRSHCSFDAENGLRKRRQTGCCARLCKCLFWILFWISSIAVILRYSQRHYRLPRFWANDIPIALAQCPSTPISYKPGELNYNFDIAADSSSNQFFFDQRWARKSKIAPQHHFIQTAGSVIVQAASIEATNSITVQLDVKFSHEELSDAINIKHDAVGLVFESTPFLETFAGVDPCISVVVIISVAPSANISSFNIDTTVLPVELRKSLQLISDNFLIRSSAGSISSAATGLNSRKVEVETTSSTISGSLPLAEFLVIKSVSGAVDVDIEPLESGLMEHAGTLVIRTSSGDIEANTFTSSIPNRNFTTEVHSVSGSITGNFLLGTSSNLNSASGNIKTDFHTAGDLTERSCMINAVSGSIFSTIHDSSYELGAVRSNFRSQTGAVDVLFPASWEGHIQGKSRTGSIAIEGENVNIVKDFSPVPGFGRVVVAEKGDGQSNISAETLNAAIHVKVG